MSDPPQIFVPSADPTRMEIWLHHPRSVDDLAEIGGALREGIVVTLRDPTSRTLEATLRFQAEVNCWTAYPLRTAKTERPASRTQQMD